MIAFMAQAWHENGTLAMGMPSGGRRTDQCRTDQLTDYGNSGIMGASLVLVPAAVVELDARQYSYEP
jgi:hypothetical protein